MRTLNLILFIALIIANPVVSQVPAAGNQTGSPNSSMNWVIATGYDNLGNILSQGKKFYDNSGVLLQTQSKVFYRSNATTVYTHVLASQPLKDASGRQVLNSLPAPINYADFYYLSNFMQASGSTNYTFANFDLYNPSGTQTDKTNTPDPIGGQTNIGTLGWYYGTSNNWEPYTPTTNYPYSRASIYKDGTNSTKKQAGTGESFVMGSGHETSSFITPVSGELSNYMQVRNQYFTSAQIGNLPTSLASNAIQTVSQDPNGREVVSISDLSGKVLMSATPGSDYQASNSINIYSPSPSIYTQAVTTVTGNAISIQSITGGNNLTLTLISLTGAISTFYAGPASSAPLNTNFGNGTLVLESDVAFTLNYTCSSTAYTSNSIYYPGGPLQTIAYFKILANNTPVTISGTYSLVDMNTEAATSLVSGQLPQGYYKITSTGGPVSVSYGNGFTNISYNFYNQLGQLVASIAPNGVKLLLTNGLSAYPTLSSVPFVSTYTYDAQGRLVTATSPDAGTSNFVYRSDGKIRFSQSALQAVNGAYSYTMYDQLGRPVESGQYDGIAIPFNSAGMTAIIQNTTSTGGFTTGTKTDVVMTTYDLPDNTYGAPYSTTYGYAQDPANLGGAISTTKRYSTVVNNAPSSTNLVSQTWYNYDEEGKVVWQIKYIASLGSVGYKTTDYTYDALSRVIKKIFQKNTSAETFVHYYTYDAANGSLLSVSTNTVDNGVASATLQAYYKYFLHGGLKRVELATNLQGIDYTYTLQGALKGINNSPGTGATDPGGDGVSPSTFASDAFGEVLDYYTNDYNNARTTGAQKIYGVNNTPATDSWAGNIKAMTWFSTKPAGMGGSNLPTTYTYTYTNDPKYQLVGSTWGNTLSFATNPASYTATTFNQEKVVIPNTTTPAYDLNGNIQYLQRTNTTGASTDVLAYAYTTNTNKLASVANTGSSAPASYTYTYDQLGRETSETTGNTATNKYIQYDVTGKVTLVTVDGVNPIAKFIYDEMGQRIEKISYNSSYQQVQATYYFGDVVYTQPIVNNVPGTLAATEYQISGGSGRIGVYYPAGSLYTYELKDHLGNVRAVIMKTGAMYTATDYYPFGMVIASFGTTYRYGYQGQTAEADGETGWNSFELRMYNPRIARWMTMDPKGQYFSPYESMGNNPVNGVDHDGGGVDDFFKIIATGEIFWSDNNDLYSDRSKYKDLGADNYTADGWTWTHFDDGHISSREVFNPINVPTISASHAPTYWQRQEDGNLLQKLFYGIANSFYVTAQNLGGKQIAGRSYAIGLNGSMTSPNENVAALANSVSLFIPGADIESVASKGGTTVIGETMDRVIQASSEIPGSQILNSMPEFTGTADQITSQMMQYNRKWILDQMRSGNTIIDIGLDANRIEKSIFYEMEQNMIKNYQILHPNSLNIITP